MTLITERNQTNHALPANKIKSVTMSSPALGGCDVDLKECQLRQLQEQGFPTGLATSLLSTATNVPLRIWVVDNSGSMNAFDGERIIPPKRKNRASFSLRSQSISQLEESDEEDEELRQNVVQIVPATRWAEIQECVFYHAQMAAMLRAPTTFRLLNNSAVCSNGVEHQQQFGVAEESMNDDAKLRRNVKRVWETIRKASPHGATPLSRHIIDIKESVEQMAPALNERGQRISIIIATDGLPTSEDGEGGQAEADKFVSALRQLEGLPVWIVVRLCTNEEQVVNFYNNLDEQLELPIEVLDDFVGEAMEVHKHNSWLNYALPLHRCRELGHDDGLFDLLDERTLTRTELKEFFVFLFGAENIERLPDPESDWKGFVKSLDGLLEAEGKQWNPVTKEVEPWVDVHALKSLHSKKGNVASRRGKKLLRHFRKN